MWAPTQAEPPELQTIYKQVQMLGLGGGGWKLKRRKEDEVDQ
jgi:hypothetical protein